MCFSADASLGTAVALLPVGGYCAAVAYRKDRAYLPLAAVPILFGVQQLCEAGVWIGLGRGDPDTARRASLAFLFFALAFWPVWVPLAVAAVEPPGRRRWVLAALAGIGVLFGCAYYVPIAADGGRGLNPGIVGHSIRYDLSGVPAVNSPTGWWVWPVLYVGAVAGSFLASGDRRLRPLGVAVVVSAVVVDALFESTFASVWCFLAAVLSVYLAYALYRLPDSVPGDSGTQLTPRAL